jgi:hypothetical protein
MIGWLEEGDEESLPEPKVHLVGGGGKGVCPIKSWLKFTLEQPRTYIEDSVTLNCMKLVQISRDFCKESTLKLGCPLVAMGWIWDM